jgi:hypothetical protein
MHHPGNAMPRECAAVPCCERSDLSAVARRAKAEAIHLAAWQNGLLPPTRKGAPADSLPGEARAASVDGSSLSLLAMTAK